MFIIVEHLLRYRLLELRCCIGLDNFIYKGLRLLLMMKQLKVCSSVSTFCVLALCFVLAGCGSSGTTPSTAASAATPASTVALAPTSAPSVKLTTATGDGYTIGYPSDWTSKQNSLSGVSILALSPVTTGSTSMLAETVASTKGVSTTGSVQGSLTGIQGQATNFHKKDVPTTVTINGITWDQGAATATDPSAGTDIEAYVISTKFPGNANKLVTIIRIAKAGDFDKANAEDFLPMLSSFKFVSS